MIKATPTLSTEFQDKEKNTVSRGAKGLIFWAKDHLTQDILKATPATTYNEFRKDPFSEKGKKICDSVRVSEIFAERTKTDVYYYATLVNQKFIKLLYLNRLKALQKAQKLSFVVLHLRIINIKIFQMVIEIQYL